mmetsp:Transcript_66409/g.104983  ORF Transcript_66409/g.104983 Transcript_66409/m.104983 type:complete len:137 (-) Transcript_66409:5-415(-)
MRTDPRTTGGMVATWIKLQSPSQARRALVTEVGVATEVVVALLDLVAEAEDGRTASAAAEDARAIESVESGGPNHAAPGVERDVSGEKRIHMTIPTALRKIDRTAAALPTTPEVAPRANGGSDDVQCRVRCNQGRG